MTGNAIPSFLISSERAVLGNMSLGRVEWNQKSLVIFKMEIVSSTVWGSLSSVIRFIFIALLFLTEKLAC